MSNIANVNDAVEVIVDKLKSKGLKAIKLRNYGYYSFIVKDIAYKELVESVFENDPRFELVVKNSYLEYIIKSNDLDLDLEFKLNYESSNKNSKMILSLNM